MTGIIRIGVTERGSFKIYSEAVHIPALQWLCNTPMADSGAQSGSVSSSWLVILPMANCHIFPSQRIWVKSLDFNEVVFF